MQIHELKRNTERKKSIQVGRGGKRGKTSGRGTKGQKARAGHKMRPEWRDIIKKLPKMRGRGVNINKAFKGQNVAISLDVLEKLPADIKRATPQTLFNSGAFSKVNGKFPSIKILAKGAITRKIEVKNCLVSEPAKKAILAAGGKVI